MGGGLRQAGFLAAAGLVALKKMREGQWHWYANSKCKYVELRVDMRTGSCIIKDREGNRIDPKELAIQNL